MKKFMDKHFKGVQRVYSDHFNAKASFVHLSTPTIAKFVFDKLRGKTVDGFLRVKVKPALTAVDITRNWALYRAEELISKDAKLNGREVELWKGKDRGVYVAGVAAFLQKERLDPHGHFVHGFEHLKLP